MCLFTRGDFASDLREFLEIHSGRCAEPGNVLDLVWAEPSIWTFRLRGCGKWPLVYPVSFVQFSKHKWLGSRQGDIGPLKGMLGLRPIPPHLNRAQQPSESPQHTKPVMPSQAEAQNTPILVSQL